VALLQNGFRDTLGAFQIFGATASNNAYPSAHHGNYTRTAAMRNLTAGQGITDDTVGLPYGYRHPGAWMMPQKAGALASHNLIAGAGAIADLNLAGGVNGEATLAGVGSLSGTGALIVSLVAALTGSGTISSATAQAFLNLAAALAGAGDVAGALTALGHAAAALSGSGTATGTATALGTLAASITVTGDLLTTANVGQAVWQELIEAGYTAEQLLRIIAAGIAGETTGVGTSTEVYKGVDGTTDRITTTFDLNNNRDTVALDGD